MAALLAGAVAKPAALTAQKATNNPHPLIERLTFDGVDSVSQRDLLGTLSTHSTRCRTFILKPLCLLTKSHIFEAHNYLDHDQLRRDVLRIKVFYWLRGFRHTQVDTIVAPTSRGVAVTFKINEGQPTVIRTLALNQTRDLISERRLRRFGLPSQGDRIDLTQLDSLRIRARRTLWDLGYGNAVVDDSAFVVDSLGVALRVLVDVGQITTVDSVAVIGNERVTTRTVRRLVGLNHGSLYKRAELLEAQRRLYRSDLFRQTLIEVPDSVDSAKVVMVSVREAPLHAMQVGAGGNTVEFGQLQGNFTLYNFMGTARRIEFHSSVGNLLAPTLYGKKIFGSATPLGTDGEADHAFLTPTWQVSASMTQPWLYSVKNSLGLSVFSNRRSVPSIVIDRGTGASATFTRTISHDIPLSLTYRHEWARIEAGDLYFCVDFGYCLLPTINALRQSHSMSPLVMSLRADRTDDPLEPHKGYTARFSAEHASAATASDWRYNRVEVEFTPYLKLGASTLTLRGHVGRVTASASTDDALNVTGGGALLHPRTRFYGGGARSVRGYAEGHLGPRVLTIDPAKLIELTDSTRGTPCTTASIADASCDPNKAPSSEFVPRPVGGNALLEGTVEYRFPIGRNLGGAVFVDAGRVGGSNLGPLLKARSAVTPGVGFRYSSPIGPVRVDLAMRPARTEDLPVMTQTTDANGKLHLIQLTTPKHFSPTEGATGFRALTSRLQLHLYIGEAY